MTSTANTYRYADAACTHAHAYLLPKLLELLDNFFNESNMPRRVFDLGCGNGSVAHYVAQHGYEVEGVDPSTEGIAQANAKYPQLKLAIGSGGDDLASRFGVFPLVYSLEVIEHVYAPREFASTLFDLVAPGGVAIISTPYHGYLKNLAVVAAGKFDHHFDPLWDNGHIKFWSENKLRTLLEQTGFAAIEFFRVGRFRPLAKSTIAAGRKA